MDYKIIIIFILLITIYCLYYLKFNSNWIIAFSIIAILIMNEIINDKEYFTNDSKLTTMRLLQTEQSKDIEYLENQLLFIKNILKEKSETQTKKQYHAIPIRNSCVVMNSDNTDTPNNDFESKYDY